MTHATAGTHTRHEILTQPQTWLATLRQLEKADASSYPDVSRYDQVIFFGCGSTHYLSQWAARACEALTGAIGRASPSSELLLFPESWRTRGRKTLMVAISRSGETTETIHALRNYLEAGGTEAVTITCYPDSSLAKMAPYVISVPEGQEQSVAQTRSFSNMMLAVSWLLTRQVPAGVPDRLDDAAQRLLQNSAPAAESWGSDASIKRIFFLGSGALYGLANEAMLKMKEISLSYAEAFHFHEFRHGPMSMVHEGSLVVGLLSSGLRDQQLAVLRDMKALGARTLGLTDEGPDLSAGALDEQVAFHSGVAEPWRAPLYLPVLQLLAYQRGMFKGLNPDRPTNLTSVVVLNEKLE